MDLFKLYIQYDSIEPKCITHFLINGNDGLSFEDTLCVGDEKYNKRLKQVKKIKRMITNSNYFQTSVSDQAISFYNGVNNMYLYGCYAQFHITENTVMVGFYGEDNYFGIHY